MNQSQYNINDVEGLHFHIDECVAVLQINSDAFDHITDLEKGGKILSLIALTEQDPSVRSFLLVNEDRSFGDIAYKRFLTHISGQDINDHTIHNILEIDKKLIRAREINVLNRFILATVEYKKMIAIGLRGRVVTSFFGASLSSDFRFAQQGMCFSLSHIKYGLHPGGALPFFLQRYVSQSKAVDILFRGGEISAEEALRLGLVNEIYPKENFLDSCIAEMKRLCTIDPALVRVTKQFTHIFVDDLKKYIDRESVLVKR